MSIGSDKSESDSKPVIAPDILPLRQDISANLNAQLAGGQFGPTAAATTLGPAMLLSILTGQSIEGVLASGAFQPSGTPFQNIGQDPLPPSGFELLGSDGEVIGTFKTHAEARRAGFVQSFKESAINKSQKKFANKTGAKPVQSAIVRDFFGGAEEVDR